MPMEPNGTPEGQALVDETEAIIKNLRGFQEQVALLDRIHSIRIRFIQVHLSALLYFGMRFCQYFGGASRYHGKIGCRLSTQPLQMILVLHCPLNCWRCSLCTWSFLLHCTASSRHTIKRPTGGSTRR